MFKHICTFQNKILGLPISKLLLFQLPRSLIVSQHRSCTCNAILSPRTATPSHNAHIAIRQYTFIIICIQTSVRLAKGPPQNCCLGNSEEYSSVAMTTDDAHPVWLVDFYLDA